jgi:hypothetical protein
MEEAEDHQRTNRKENNHVRKKHKDFLHDPRNRCHRCKKILQIDDWFVQKMAGKRCSKCEEEIWISTFEELHRGLKDEKNHQSTS